MDKHAVSGHAKEALSVDGDRNAFGRHGLDDEQGTLATHLGANHRRPRLRREDVVGGRRNLAVLVTWISRSSTSAPG